MRNRESEDSDREPSVLQRMVFERPIQCERTATGERTLKTAQGKAMKDARAALSRKSLRRGRERKLARSSEKERRVDARALIADEGRDKLRKAAGISKYEMIRRCPNGAIRRNKAPASYTESIGV